jgi:hypothetical protein
MSYTADFAGHAFPRLILGLDFSISVFDMMLYIFLHILNICVYIQGKEKKCFASINHVKPMNIPCTTEQNQVRMLTPLHAFTTF